MELLKLKILCFGITKELLGGFERWIEIPKDSSVEDLKELLLEINPEFEKLKNLRIAINEEYVDNDVLISENDEIVLIPPVSGG
jgi:molybdopterin converting factor subunit 1